MDRSEGTPCEEAGPLLGRAMWRELMGPQCEEAAVPLRRPCLEN